MSEPARVMDAPKRSAATFTGIRLRGVSKRFRGVQALDRVDLDVEPGQIVALLGPNGAGKSTLLRILGTTVLADDGEAFVGGHDVVSDQRAARRACGLMLSDERSWYWRISGRRNLEFFAALYGYRRSDARRVADEMLERFGLTAAADRPFGGYSAGMRARLSLARSLLPDPTVLLLDEPTRNLDPVASVRFRETVRSLSADRGVAVLFATHDLHEAADLASVVVALDRGRISFTRPAGTPAAELEAAMVQAMYDGSPGGPIAS